MSAITSTGLGSGLEINSIVGAIVGAEKEPAMAKMVSEAADATAKISAYGVLNSALSDFQDSYSSLAYSSTFSAATAVSSDTSILDTTLGIGAATGNWSFEVEQLAQAQTLVSSAATSYDEATSEVGTGVITFSYGSYEDDGSFSLNPDQPIETLTIDATNNSLDKMRNEINKGDYSVEASIIDDGNDYRLVLTNKETGAQNAVQITVTDDDANNIDNMGLSSLTYSATVKNMDQTSVAQDAKIVMNGIEVTRSNNNISNVIEGVTLNLNGETAVGKTVSLSITQDTTGVEEQLNAFVENYNAIITQMNSLAASGGEADHDGALNGDSTLRNIESQMRALLNTQMSHLDGAVKGFADLGMLTKLDGTLEIDSTLLINSNGTTSSHNLFTNALANQMDSIAEFFTSSGGASDSLVEFEKNSSITKPGTYSLEVTKLPTQGELSGLPYVLPISIDEDNDTFTMRLDGYLSEDIVLSAGTYNTSEDFMTELQSKINSDPKFVDNNLNVSVTEDAGVFSIASNSYGTVSSIAISSIESASFTASTGFSVGGGTMGTNVVGKIDGFAAIGSGETLIGKTGDAMGMRVKVLGGELGDRGTVTYSDGMSSMLDDMLDGIIDSNVSSSSGDIQTSGSTIDGAIDSQYKIILDLDKQKEDLIYRTDKMEARLYKQYNAMDSAVNGLNNTREWLKSSLESLPGSNRN